VSVGHASCDLREDRFVAKEVVLTVEGFEKLKAEIEELSTVKRREVAERIKEAREFGDISENSEYDDAKNEQAMLESRISQLEERLREAKVIDAADLPSDVVSLGSTVTIAEGSGDRDTYQIVGSAEADPDENRLSNESPVGRAILGHRKGETIDVVTPSGARKITIVSISSS
jgi:transcription elongation factor GreA